MCFIFSCFGWVLDFIQRLITFGLAFILCCTVCFGLTIAIVAGIAYGYNYSMAEFMTFTRSDVTVFMRRGQFYEKPDVGTSRRSGSEDMFSSNISTDYEDQRTAVESKPLAESWSKTQDTRKYAESLTRYNPGRKANVQEPETQEREHVREPPDPVIKLPAPVRELPSPVRDLPASGRKLPTQATPRNFYLKTVSVSPIISIVPNPLMPTVTWRSGSSNIVMRNFQPMMHDYMVTNKHTGVPETLFPARTTKLQPIPLFNPKAKSKGYIDGKIQYDDENFLPMRMWGTTARPVIPDEPEDVDEDNIVYKPV